MLYDRKIKYVHMYEKDEKIQNVGFVKLEVVEDKVNMYIHFAGLRHASKEECVVMAKGKDAEAILGKMCLEYGKGNLDIKGLTLERVAEGISYDELEEIFVNLSIGVKLRCIIREVCREQVEDILAESSEVIREASSEEVTEERAEDLAEKEEVLSEAELLREAFEQERRILEESARKSETEPEECAKVPGEEMLFRERVQEEMQKAGPMPIRVNSQIMQPEREEQIMAADKWQQLWSLYPHMKPFEDGREYLVVKPQDFVILQKPYYALSANSFLLHGYYNYEHLVMCRETRKDEDRFYIGVPGNFYEKEKRVALLFGFESFEGKREPAGNGDFGYYMVRVEI